MINFSQHRTVSEKRSELVKRCVNRFSARAEETVEGEGEAGGL